MFLFTVPSDGPASISPGTVTANSIAVQWEEVPCPNHNGDITGYTVVARTNGVDDVFVNVDVREATLSGLNPSTNYSVTIAAINSAGTGPYHGIIVKTSGEYNNIVRIVVNLNLMWDISPKLCMLI